ncbi:charged multivesicular body protein 7 [Mangifera indica]|uniref:charged multivesicular body protein 7 n=1 Tax=Mangifera indica TaxID=29780 RepID=UPI001CF990B8|nr:charged multivesicular body protein 7 [Mangifera indica]
MGSSSVSEFITNEVPDWSDDVVTSARFKAFSGQRSDWEPKFQFWRDLILKIACHFDLLIIHPSKIKNEWFNRGGLTPLCLDHVLFVMYNEGDIIRSADLVDPTSGRLSQLFWKVRRLVAGTTIPPEVLLKDHVIFATLMKDKAGEVVKCLSESHWTSSCIITMKKFQDMCGGKDEASAVLSYLSGCGKAQYLSITKKDYIEGLKVSLSPASVSSISSFDCDVLHLVWTMEKLQQQLDVTDRQYEMSRKSALTSLQSGNKTVALRHAKQLKLAKESREKCTSLLNRVEEVLCVIENSESTKKVSEAIQIGAQAIKKNKINVEEVQICLEELEHSIDMQKQVEKVLESAPLDPEIDDEDIEEEFKKLQLEVESENSRVLIPKTGLNEAARETLSSESTESLSAAFSSLGLGDGPARASASGIQSSVEPFSNKESDSRMPEAA